MASYATPADGQDPKRLRHHRPGFDGDPSDDLLSLSSRDAQSVSVLSGDTGTGAVTDTLDTAAAGRCGAGAGAGSSGGTTGTTSRAGLDIVADDDTSITGLQTSDPALDNAVVGAITIAPRPVPLLVLRRE